MRPSASHRFDDTQSRQPIMTSSPRAAEVPSPLLGKWLVRTIGHSDGSTKSLCWPIVRLGASLAIVVMLSGVAHAVDYYWDINGATAGAGGAAPSGTWNTSTANWSTDSAGGVATGLWTDSASNTATFSAGSDATGAYTITLSGNRTAGTVTVQDGAVTLLGSTQFNSLTGNIALSAPTLTLQIPNSGTGDWWYGFGAISGGANNAVIIKGGGGAANAAAGGNRVVFGSGTASTYGGGTTIESGQLQLQGNSAAAGTGNITLGNANTGAAVNQLRLGVNIANNIVVSAAAPNSAAGIGTYNSLQTLTGGLQVDRPVTIYGAGDRLTWSGANAIWSGAGDITISGGRVTHDTAVNTWNGKLTINSSSVFQIGAPGSALANASSVTVNGDLRLALGPNGTATIPELDGASTGRVYANSGGAGAGTRTLSIGASNGDGSFAGLIGPGTAGGEILAITKIGTGTQTLSGANTYAGGTLISAGTLKIANILGSATGSGPVNVGVNGTLSGPGSIVGGTVDLYGTVSPGNSPGTLFADNFNWQSGGTYDWELGNFFGNTPGTDWDLLDLIGGNLSFVGAGPFNVDIDVAPTGIIPNGNYVFEIARANNVVSFNALNFALTDNTPGNIQWSILQQGNSVYLQAAVTPEPATWAMFVVGGIACLLGSQIVARRRGGKTRND